MAKLSSLKYSNIARPYALAAFELAREQDTLPAWKGFLERCALIGRQPEVSNLMGSPRIILDQMLDLFETVLTSQGEINAKQKNFLSLLAQNKRLMLISEINELFILHCSALEKVSQVRVISAVPMDEAYQQKLIQALAQRIQNQVTLQCEVDPALLGGAVIHVGDRVIDGSVRGKLNRLLQDLTHA